jgi:DeoR/GlpR family transcriptional regulator of sugar metabolism
MTLGVTPLDPVYGLSTPNHPEAEIKQLLIKAGRQRTGLADHAKFGRQSFAFVGLVTDAGVDHAYVDHVQNKGLR